MKVPIRLVNVPEHRYRKTRQAQVDALAESITEVGLLNPITVYATDIMPEDSRVFVPGYRLISGEHRLLACKKLGWTEIDAHVVEISELQRQMAECDENLFGPKLTDAERARLTKRRKQAYEALHPETRKGQAGGRARQGDQTANLAVSSPVAKSAVADIAAKTGKSERTVRREAERGEKITDEALALVRGTALDKGDYLDKLKKVEPDKQVAKVKADLTLPGHTSSKDRADVVTEGNTEDGHEEGTEADQTGNEIARLTSFLLDHLGWGKSHVSRIMKDEPDPLRYLRAVRELDASRDRVVDLFSRFRTCRDRVAKADKADPNGKAKWAMKLIGSVSDNIHDLYQLPAARDPSKSKATRPSLGELQARTELVRDAINRARRLFGEIADSFPAPAPSIAPDLLTDEDIPAFLKGGTGGDTPAESAS